MTKAGIGYRREIADATWQYQGAFDCLEIIADSFIRPSAAKLAELDRLRSAFVLVPHGLRLSIGSADRPSPSYLRDLAWLLDRIGAPYHSDHLAMTSAAGIELGHLSPLWYTSEGLATVIANVRAARLALGHQLVLETITEPFTIPGATMTMPEFVTEVCAATGCGLLLDVTNIYINARNAGQDPADIVGQLPLAAVRQLHLVGFGTAADGTLIDSHSEPVQPELWSFYDYVRGMCQPEFVIIERDADFPEITELAREVSRARLAPSLAAAR